MKTHISKLLIAAVVLIALNPPFSTLHAQGTAFTYQGRLNAGGTPANGSYDLTFSLFSASSGGSAVAGPLTNNATTVSNGLFLATLDFGGVFTGTNYWLEIGVRTNGNGVFINLAPRQPVTPTPYAIFAEVASNVVGVLPTGGLSGSYGSAVTMNNSANQFNGSFTGNGGGLTNLNVGSIGGLTTSNFWQLGGNNVAPGKFLGSTNNQPVEIRVNNLLVAQLSYASNTASGYSPNVVLGDGANIVGNGVVGATIAGGGSDTQRNGVSADFGTVIGGLGNLASGTYAVAVGGSSLASGVQSIAVGGSTATADYTTAMGNSGASGKFSTAFGSSTASARQAFASGLSTASGQSSTAIGGSTASGFGATAIGSFATASGDYSTALGQSTATNLNATAAGASSAFGQYSTAMGNSTVVGDYSTAMGNSVATNSGATALGGSHATGSGSSAFGYSTASASYATAAGISTASAPEATAAGNSIASAFYATAAGQSTASGYESTAFGNSLATGYASFAVGNMTAAYGIYSFAVGNRAKANYDGAFVWADSQSADFTSTANDQFCIRAQGGVMLDNSTPSINFGNQTREMLKLWASGGIDYGIGVQNNREYFRTGGGFAWFLNGVHSDTADDPGSGGTELMTLTYGGITAADDCGLFYVAGPFLHVKGNMTADGNIYCSGLCQSSDRNLKENFHPIDPVEILNKVADLPISQWNYKKEARVGHVGPMAQDFYAAFNIGPDDKHITTIDESGVALAAIQGLNEKVEGRSQQAEGQIAELKAQNAELKQRLEALEKIILNQK